MKKIFSSKYMVLVVSFVIMLTLLVGCSSGNTNEKTNTNTESFNGSIIDSSGETITLTSVPQRIVSLAPNTTEILCALGLEDRIVGRTDYCNYPKSVETIPSIGGTYNPNIEAIIALEPDLVLSATHVPKEVTYKLRDVGIPVAFLNEEENFEGTMSTITNIGILTGTEAEAETVVAEMEMTIDNILREVDALQKTEKPKVYYMVGFGEQDFTAGGNTFISEMIGLAGGQNIAQNIQGWSISREEILADEPDMIIMPSDLTTLETLQQTEFYKDLDAVKSGHVYEIDGDMISRQGPRIADALVEMAKIINPELNN